MELDSTTDRPSEPESAGSASQSHPQTYSYGEQPTYTELPRLTVTDGFRFGCGFMLAAAAAYFAALIAVTLFVIIAALAGIQIPFLGR